MIPLSPRLIAAGVALLAVLALLVGGWGWLSHLRAQAAKVPALETQVRQARADQAATMKSWKASEEVSRGYQSDLAKARAHFDAVRSLPARVVRVCNEPARVPETAGAGRPDDAEPAAPETAGSARPDIGPDLYGLADAGDLREAELAAKVDGLQRFIREQCAAQ